MFSPMCAVVIEANDFNIVILAYKPGMVLKAKLGIFWNLERAVFSIQFPDYASISAIDLVDAARIARGNEIVTL